MLTIYNPLTVCLVAAMAIPAFQKVRANSEAMAITNNLRMLSAAADQYYIEKGVNTAAYDDLVGPDKYVKAVVPVAGEDYHQIAFAQGLRLTVRLPDGRMFSYPMVPSQPFNTGNTTGIPVVNGDAYKRRGVVNNLKVLANAANRYYDEKGVTTTTFSEIMSEPVHPHINPVMGEDYSSVVLEKGVPVQIKLPDGRVVRLPVFHAPPPLGPHPLPVQQVVSRSDAEIMENLRKLNAAANAYYDANGTTSVNLDDLVGPKNAIPELVPVAGEDYHSVIFMKGHPLSLFLKDGRTLIYPPPSSVHP
jgi:type II secretory pathway pseudopilin PulG